MNNLKFRVWCKNENRWEQHKVFIDSDGHLWQIMPSDKLVPLKSETHIVQFFTGSHDKNGNEVWGGDIIEWTEKSYPMDVDGFGRDLHTPGFKGDKPQIDVHRGKVYYDEKRAKFRVTDWSNGRPLSDFTGELRPMVKIGNIYEHPHLLPDRAVVQSPSEASK